MDACRTDALREVQGEYDFLISIESRRSRGSTSKEWLENTFTESYREEISSTAYITANYYSSHLDREDTSRLEYPIARGETVAERFFSKLIRNNVVDSSDFAEFVKLYDKIIGEDIMQLPPGKVTDCAINVTRETDYDRYIVHYMQPHHPFIYSDQKEDWHEEPFKYLNETGDLETVWNGYLDNLRLVLDEVELLLKNIDAEKTVLTADHGELFGEWGLHAHGIGFPHPKVRRVPWAETTATDTGSYKPESVFSNKQASEEELKERLSALGYR